MDIEDYISYNLLTMTQEADLNLFFDNINVKGSLWNWT
ncbi:hypothetical protein NMY3_01243 [Candidatus Nitrosocosmicus oleophilus]|uniref:Uncharacterized protein n=1 Tax=Candidatus Nitrosocosmicus oleophilus TaxID=1353260 RepID=A0A654LWQ6_9ARCH|nr:hypothetical protein NMY3_01243 [Candidatus Nitrosocosmicus oleophilus]